MVTIRSHRSTWAVQERVIEGVERLQSESEFRLPVDVDGAAGFRVDLRVDLRVAGP